MTAISATDLYAVGFFGDAATNGQDETLVEHFDGKQWRIIASPTKGLAQQLNGAFALPGMLGCVDGRSLFDTRSLMFESRLLQLPKTLVLFSENGAR